MEVAEVEKFAFEGSGSLRKTVQLYLAQFFLNVFYDRTFAILFLQITHIKILLSCAL